MDEKKHSSGPADDAPEQLERDAHAAPDMPDAVAAMAEQCACCPEIMGTMMDKHRARHANPTHPVKP